MAMGRVAMQSERDEVVRDLRALAVKMRDVADAMWRLHMGVMLTITQCR